MSHRSTLSLPLSSLLYRAGLGLTPALFTASRVMECGYWIGSSFSEFCLAVITQDMTFSSGKLFLIWLLSHIETEAGSAGDLKKAKKRESTNPHIGNTHLNTLTYTT